MTPAKESARLAKERDEAYLEAKAVMERAALDLVVGIRARMAVLRRQLEQVVDDGEAWLVTVKFHQNPACNDGSKDPRGGCAVVTVRRRVDEKGPDFVYSSVCYCGPQNVALGNETQGAHHYKDEPDKLVPFAAALADTKPEQLVTAFLDAVRREHQAAQTFLNQSRTRAEAACQAGRGVLNANAFAQRVRGAA